MSIFGKVLAVFNLLGVAAVLVLGLMDYAKRQTYAFWDHRLELYLLGIPIDAVETNARGRVLAEMMGPGMLGEVFPSGLGEPVTNQAAEIEQVHSKLLARINASGDVRKRLPVTARILTPLADTWVERQHLVAIHHHLGSEANEKKFRDLYDKAWKTAITSKDTLPLSSLFRQALTDTDPTAAPSEPLTTRFLAALPADAAAARKANFDATLKTALEAQDGALKGRLAEHYKLALEGKARIVGKGEFEAYEEKRDRRGPAARFLVRLTPVLAEDAATTKQRLQGMVAGSPRYESELVQTDGYKVALDRAQAVVGYVRALEALDEHARVYTALQPLAERATRDARELFVAGSLAQVNLLRRRQQYIDDAEVLKNFFIGLHTEQQKIVNVRAAEVKKVAAEPAALEKETAREQAALQAESARLFALRIIYRNAQDKSQKDVDTIRQREQLALRLERAKKSRADALR